MKVLVVGAGIMGLSIAVQLQRAGCSVTVVDQQGPDSSHRASSDHHRLIRLPYGELTGYQALVPDAFEAWDRLWTRLGWCGYVETGTLVMGSRDSGWLNSSRQNLPPASFEELLPGHKIRRQLHLGDDAEAFLVPRGGLLLADRILAALRNAFSGPLVEAIATSVDSDSGAVAFSDGLRTRADLVIVSLGAWPWPQGSPQAKRTPSRQTALYLEQPPSWPVAPFVLDLTPASGFYFVPGVGGTPAKIGRHAFTRQGTPDDDRACTATEHLDLDALRLGRATFCRDWTVLGAIANYYDLSPDERFLTVRQGKGLWLGGFSGHGFKFAALIGELVSEYALNRVSFEDLAARLAGLPPTKRGRSNQ